MKALHVISVLSNDLQLSYTLKEERWRSGGGGGGELDPCLGIGVPRRV